MKKMIFGLLFSIFGLLLMGSNAKGAVKTGHDDFLNIYFEGDQRLIVDYSEEEVEDIASRIKRKAFGWKTVYINYNCKVEYDGKIIFSKINKTEVPFYFEYRLKEEEVKTRSVNVNGSVSAKITGTIQKIKTTLTSSGSAGVEYEDENVSTSELLTIIEMDILPNKKLTMITTGEAYINSGYSKYYLFGITIKKGLWETIETETVYYELREETV